MFVLQVEDYDVYAYYANNYKDAFLKFEKLLEDPEFVSYLEVKVPTYAPRLSLELRNALRFHHIPMI